jgi:hypothetical protein
MIGHRFPSIVELARVDDAAFELVARRAFADLAWIDDGWCSGRSLVGAQLLSDASGRPLGAALNGVGSALDAMAGAVAIADGPFVHGGGRRWGYHAVAVGWPESSATPMAIDGALFRRPVSLDAWSRRIGADPARVALRHPWDLRGLSISESMANGAERARDELMRSVRSVADAGVAIDNPLMHGRSISGPGSVVTDTGRGAWLARADDVADWDPIGRFG